MARVRRLRWAILRRWFRSELDQTFWEGADWGWQQRQWGEKAANRQWRVSTVQDGSDPTPWR